MANVDGMGGLRSRVAAMLPHLGPDPHTAGEADHDGWARFTGQTAEHSTPPWPMIQTRRPSEPLKTCARVLPLGGPANGFAFDGANRNGSRS